MAARVFGALRRGTCLPLVLVFVVVAVIVPVASRAMPADQVSVHAAYVINFVRYARWPDTVPPAQPRVIAVLGSRESVATFGQLARQAGTVEGQPLVVRALPLSVVLPSRAEADRVLRKRLDGAHVVYVAESHRAWNRAVIAATRGRPVLTVGVGRDFVAAGGMFGLIDSGGRVRFTANEAVIRRSPIHISARVLMLARSPNARDG